MKRFLNWLLSNKSDFLLFIIVLVLLNLVSIHSFFRIDLTKPKSYSLSESSKQLVKTLEEPVSVKVFFSSNLPAPYNTTAQYLTDLLTEYKGAANKNFTWESFNMEDKQNQSLAQNYRLQQIQIQEVKDNEVGFKNAWMGLVILYSDQIEVVDGITSSEGLEYKLTTKISKMIASTSALAGLSGKVKLSLYLTPKLAEFNIENFSAIEKTVSSALAKVNRKNNDRIAFERIDPPADEIQAISTKYGLQTIEWTGKNGEAGKGLISLVLEYGDNFRVLPLQMARSLFGGYGIAGLEGLEDALATNLKALVSKSETIAYITGHGEKNLSDAQYGAANFAQITSDWYTFKELNLAEEDIPSNITTIIINGPQTAFTQAELYKIDQFMMKGGNMGLFLDPFNEIQDQAAAYYGAPPQYVKNETGLETLLQKYGLVLKDGYAMDKECYTSNQKGYGTLNFYYAPLVQQENLNQKNPISTNLAYVLFVQSGAIDVSVDKNEKDRSATILAKTSPQAWLLKDQIMLNPMYLSPPAAETMQQENLAVLLEGKFSSAFDKNPSSLDAQNDKDNLKVQNHLASSLQKGKIFMVANSHITTSAVIDETGAQPVALFIRNAVDYLNGNEDLCLMRTKGLSLNTLKKATPKAATLAKAINQYGLPLLIVIIGLLVWRLRSIRRQKIRARYMTNTTASVKGGTND